MHQLMHDVTHTSRDGYTASYLCSYIVQVSCTVAIATMEGSWLIKM